MTDQLDVLLLVPTPTKNSYFHSTALRTNHGPTALKIIAAAHRLESFVGRNLGVGGSVFDNYTDRDAERSLTSVALCTVLEREGLQWACVDPGSQPLSYWRSVLAGYVDRRPRCVAISTTYFVTEDWLQILIQIIRTLFGDQTTVLAGGYMYGTDSRAFLALRADVLCVGEGEERFPKVVRALREGRPLDGIPGLYLRRPDGTLQHTGTVGALDLRSLPFPDWRLAARIVPPLDLERDRVRIGVETQRGCVFKCEFCTFRTLTMHNMMSPEQAVEAIFNTSVVKRGQIFLADATATFPRERWQQVLEGLIARGGSPHPIMAFARVSDLTPENVTMMARAGVGGTFIGQESGHEGTLKAMKKGTHLSQVRPAIRALAGSGIHTTFGFIHGFPGETPESIQATRDLICTINDGFEGDPVVHQYVLSPFIQQDLAAVSLNDRLERLPPKACIEAALETFIAASRIPHAPASDYVGTVAVGATTPYLPGATPLELFRWTKLLQRGVGLFLEEDFEGRGPNLAELRRIREQILRPMPPPSLVERAHVAGIARRIRTLALEKLCGELDREGQQGIGPLTRLYLSGTALIDSRSLRHAHDVWSSASSVRSDAKLDQMAKELIDDRMEQPKLRVERHRANVRSPAP